MGSKWKTALHMGVSKCHLVAYGSIKNLVFCIWEHYLVNINTKLHERETGRDKASAGGIVSSAGGIVSSAISSTLLTRY